MSRSLSSTRSIGRTVAAPSAGVKRAAGLGLLGWALVLQFGAAGALGAQTCKCDGTTAERDGGGKSWWMLLLPAGAAGLIAGLPGGGAAPALAAPVITESGGAVALPAEPVVAPAVVTPMAPVGPKVKSDQSIPVKKDGKPDSTKADPSKAPREPAKDPSVPAPLLVGGLGLGAGAWGFLLKKKLVAALTSLG